ALSPKLPTQSTQEEVADFGFDLYWEVLAPFSDVIVIFVAEIGSLRTAAILQRWARIPLTVFRFSPHILIVTEDNDDPHLKEVLDTFTRNPGGGMRVSTLICGLRVASAISSLAEQSNEARMKLGLNFAHRHRSFLTQISLQHFCNNLPLPDFVTASRLTNPVPPSAEYHLQNVVKAFDSRIPKLPRLIASALVLDAFPSEMHHFRPKDVFQVIYKHIIRQLQTALAAQAFLSDVQSAFTTSVLKNRADKLKSASSHAHCLRLIGSAAVGVDLTGTCVFCLLRRPIFTLDCQHQLCSYCVIASGAASRNSMYSLSICPWCQETNTRLFSLKPPTAGFRILDLGTGSDMAKMCAFLKELHKNTITALPLRDYFDIV
ncbi:hypothetical protein F5883DRAFT_369055, partial [Diaporthe sp. PMI_573]